MHNKNLANSNLGANQIETSLIKSTKDITFIKRLSRLSQQMTEFQAVDDLFDYMIGEAIELTGTGAGFIALRQADGGLQDVVTRAPQGVLPKQNVLRQRLVQDVVSGGLPLAKQIDSTINSQRYLALCAPLNIDGQTVGVIYVESNDTLHSFFGQNLALLEFIGIQAAFGMKFVENKRISVEKTGALSAASRNELSTQNLSKPTVQDPTNTQAEAEGKLQEIYSIVENSAAIVISCTADEGWPVEFITNNIEQFGYTVDEFVSGKIDYDQIIHPDDVEWVNDEVQEYATKGIDLFNQEYRILTRSGVTRWVMDSNVVVRNEQGNITHYQGSILDITELKQAQIALKQANIVVENSPVVLLYWTVGKEQKVEYASENFRKFGYAADDLISGRISLQTIVHPDDLLHVEASAKRAIREGHNEFSTTFRSINKEQKVHWVEQNAQLVRNYEGIVTHIQAVLIDITAHKELELELQKTQERYEIAVAGSKDGIWDWDLVTDEVYFSTRAKQMLGYTAQDSLNNPSVFAEHLHPDERTQIIQEVQKYIEGRALQYSRQFRLRCKNGHYIWVHAVGVVLRDKRWKAYRWAGSLSNITESRKVEEDLRQAKVVVENSPIILIRRKADEQLTIEYVSENIDRFGYSASELISQSTKFLSLMHVDDIEPSRQEVLQHIRDKRIVNFSHCYRLYTADGDIRWVEDQVKIERTEDGRVTGFQGTLIDITERHEAEQALRESEAQLRTMLDSFPIPIAIKRYDGSYVYANDQFGHLRGASPEKIVSEMNAYDFYIAPEKRRIERQEINVTGASNRTEYLYKREDGTQFWAESVGHQIQYRGESVLLATFIDLSERKEIERTLREAKDAAEVANDTKSMFLSNMTHELRTPMNGVLGMTNLLLDTTLDKTQRELVDTIQNSGDTLLTIINDVLDFSKIEAGKLELELAPFNLVKAIEDSIELFRVTVRAKGIELNWSKADNVPDWIHQDVTRLRQTVTNLLGNAIKFTENGSVTLRITATALENETHRIQFSIQDTGIGIPAEQRNKLFQSFSQADVSTTRKFGGTGLGLAISRQLCELMGGKIWVESELGTGSTFSFTIVAEKARQQDETSHRQTNHRQWSSSSAGQNEDPHLSVITPHTKRALKVLLVEDNVVNQKVAVGMLKKCGYNADVAANGIEALDALHRQSYDIVFMDIHMPEMDGVTATKRIRSDFPQNAQPVIIALTADAMEQHKNEYLAIGMDAYLSKPIRIEDMQDTLNRVTLKG